MSKTPKVKEIMRILKVGSTQPSVVSISPIQAKEILRYNTNNRRVSENTVNKYARRMLDNQWRNSNDAISFSENGELSNGQHRLRAIIKADKTVSMLVTFNTDNFAEMDRGKSRTIADNISTDSRFRNTNIGVNKNIQQIAINLVRILKSRSETEDVATVLEKYGEDFEYLDSLGIFTGTMGFKSKAISSALFMGYKNGVDVNVLKRIREVLNNGITESDNDIPIIALRDKIMTSGYGGYGDKTKYLYTCYTIKAVNRGSTTKRCKLEQTKYELDLKF